jgi:hypothetical protein
MSRKLTKKIKTEKTKNKIEDRIMKFIKENPETCPKMLDCLYLKAIYATAQKPRVIELMHEIVCVNYANCDIYLNRGKKEDRLELKDVISIIKKPNVEYIENYFEGI